MALHTKFVKPYTIHSECSKVNTIGNKGLSHGQKIQINYHSNS